MAAYNTNHLSASAPMDGVQSLASPRSSFTEAVPLCLSSSAHMTIPLDQGVVDGIREIIEHTQISCVNYARKTSLNQYSLRELWVDNWAWEKMESPDLPQQLLKVGFRHHYVQRTSICLGQPGGKKEIENWLDDEIVLGTISLHYGTEELFTEEELNDPDQEEEDDLPSSILFRVLVEYRSLPPTGNKEAVEAEELSMLSFGGSVDDAVKYGALASLYDEHAKYVMEICSVRGKKYKFDVMNSTLSDGRLPRWRSHIQDQEPPFMNSLCATVTDHANTDNISRLGLVLDGNLRKPKDCHPSIYHYTKNLEKSFLLWSKPVSIMAIPSNQALLLNSELAGKIFVNGRYITTWGEDSRIGTHVKALFGLDLHSLPVWHGRIVDYDMMKQFYSTVWQEVLVDSRLMQLNLSKMLLYRLMYGKDEEEVYDDDDDVVDTSHDTLESQVMSSAKYDPVGICAKALATRFSLEFGKEAFPCLAHEVQAVKHQLGHRTPVVVPARVISVLRRGGYFDLARTEAEIWFIDNIRAPENQTELALIAGAVQMLNDFGVELACSEPIVFVKIDDPHPEKHNNLCRYREEPQKFYLNESLAKSKPFWVALAVAKAHPDGDAMHQFLEKHCGAILDT